MHKKVSYVLFVLILLLSACGGKEEAKPENIDKEELVDKAVEATVNELSGEDEEEEPAEEVQNLIVAMNNDIAVEGSPDEGKAPNAGIGVGERSFYSKDDMLQLYWVGVSDGKTEASVFRSVSKGNQWVTKQEEILKIKQNTDNGTVEVRDGANNDITLLKENNITGFETSVVENSIFIQYSVLVEGKGVEFGQRQWVQIGEDGTVTKNELLDHDQNIARSFKTTEGNAFYTRKSKDNGSSSVVIKMLDNQEETYEIEEKYFQFKSIGFIDFDQKLAYVREGNKKTYNAIELDSSEPVYENGVDKDFEIEGKVIYVDRKTNLIYTWNDKRISVYEPNFQLIDEVDLSDLITKINFVGVHEDEIIVYSLYDFERKEMVKSIEVPLIGSVIEN